MDAWFFLHITCLLIGAIVSMVLGKLILKYYSTILFTDRNIFTYLSSASVIALQLIVHSRVGEIQLRLGCKLFPQILVDLIAEIHPIPLYAAVPLRVVFWLGVGYFFSISTFSTGFRMLFIFKVLITQMEELS